MSGHALRAVQPASESACSFLFIQTFCTFFCTFLCTFFCTPSVHLLYTFCTPSAQQYDAVVLESHVDGWECKSENGSCLGGKYRAELVSLHHEPIRANHVSRHSATSACPRPLSSSAGVPVVTAGWPPLVTKLCNCTPVNLIARCVVYKQRRHVQPEARRARAAGLDSSIQANREQVRRLAGQDVAESTAAALNLRFRKGMLLVHQFDEACV